MKNFSWGPFFIGVIAGLIVGAVLLGAFVNYLISNALSSKSTAGLPLSGAIDQVREGIANDSAEQKTLAAYGHLVSNENGTLVLTVYRQNKDQNMTFTYDATTNFITIANDDAATQLPLSSDSIVAGDRVTVYTNEPIGSVTPQHAVKAIKY